MKIFTSLTIAAALLLSSANSRAEGIPLFTTQTADMAMFNVTADVEKRLGQATIEYLRTSRQTLHIAGACGSGSFRGMPTAWCTLSATLHNVTTDTEGTPYISQAPSRTIPLAGAGISSTNNITSASISAYSHAIDNLMRGINQLH